MEIIQSKKRKVISALIVLIMIVNMTMPILAATYTGSVNVGDKLKFTGTSWTIYKTEAAAAALNKNITNGTLKKNNEVTIQSKSGNVLKIGNQKYIYYGSTAASNFKKVSSASNTTKPASSNTTKTTSTKTTKVNTKAAGSIASGIVGIVSVVVKSIVSIISGLISSRTTTPPTVTPTNGITLNKTTVELNVGKTYQLTANKQVNWSSSNNAVALVSDKGMIAAKGTGSATITATLKTDKSKTATCKVTVSKTSGEKKYKEGTYKQSIYNEFKRNRTSWESKARYVYNALINAGATKAGAAGAIGNISQECRWNINQDVTNSYGKFYGMVMWGNGRRENLREKPGYNTIQVQTSFMINELKNSYKSTWETLTTTNDVITACDTFRAKYEVCGAAKADRKEFAIDWYNYFNGITKY